ncbi:hypothetical protein Ddc_22689 [Ditylenchus destructor]|nr:hypothetical protein Ddc_22689 [Ditylenchus destructor]
MTHSYRGKPGSHRVLQVPESTYRASAAAPANERQVRDHDQEHQQNHQPRQRRADGLPQRQSVTAASRTGSAPPVDAPGRFPC